MASSSTSTLQESTGNRTTIAAIAPATEHVANVIKKLLLIEGTAPCCFYEEHDKCAVDYVDTELPQEYHCTCSCHNNDSVNSKGD